MIPDIRKLGISIAISRQIYCVRKWFVLESALNSVVGVYVFTLQENLKNQNEEKDN